MTFSFGSTPAAKPLFGTAAATSTGFTFGSSTATTSAPAAGLFNFNTTPAANTGLAFGTSTFGKPGGASAFGTSTGAFGTGGIGTGIGLAGGGLGTSGLGGGATALGGLLSTTGNAPYDPAANLASIASAVSVPLIFGDERDAILAKWNQIQAYWGTGKGYYTQQGNFVTFTPQNPFCRFKAVGYSCLPRSRNKDGLVALQLKVKADMVEANQQELVASLHRLLGNKPTLSVCVEGVRGLPGDKSELLMYVQERTAGGTVRRVPASELAAYIQQPTIRQQFMTMLGVDSVVARTALGTDQMKTYLDNPPSGIDALIWQQAKLDNPDSDRLLPVPMIGFNELHQRLLHQEQQTKLHQARIDIITQDISKLQKDHANMLSKIDEYKRKQLELSHRVLQVMVRQEIWRKLGYSMHAEEEQLRVQLEATQAELNAPTQFKGRLNELMSQIRLQHQTAATAVGVRSDTGYQIDSSVQDEIKQHLRIQQEGLKHLTNIIRDDLEDLCLIEEGLKQRS